MTEDDKKPKIVYYLLTIGIVLMVIDIFTYLFVRSIFAYLPPFDFDAGQKAILLFGLGFVLTLPASSGGRKDHANTDYYSRNDKCL